MGGKRQANILSSVITNFETVEDVIETSMNSSGSAIEENERWMDSIEGKTYQFTNALETMWSNMLDTEVIKGFIDFGTSTIKFLDTVPGKITAIVVALAGLSKLKGISLLGLGQEAVSNFGNLKSAYAQIGAITKSLPTGGMIPTESLLQYASAVNKLTAAQQANLLASQGLSKSQIQQVMQYNNLSDAVINEATAHTFAKSATDSEISSQSAMFAIKSQNVAASLRAKAATADEATATQLKAAANALEASTTRSAAQASLDKLLATGAITPAIHAETVATLGLSSANTTLKGTFDALMASMGPIGWISLAISAISLITSGIKAITKSAEELKEEAKEVIDTYDNAQKTLASNSKTISSIVDDYEKLSSGVDKFGNNISLTTDEFERYNSIVNQIADMFPTMVTGYTEEGNAILNTKGNVEALTQAYQDQAKAARDAVILSGDTVFASAKNDIESAQEQIDAYNVAIKMANGQTFKSAVSQYGEHVVHDAEKILKEYGFESSFNKYASGSMEKTYGLATKFDKRSQTYVNDYTYEDEKEHAERVNKLMLGRNNLLSTQQGYLSKVNKVLQAYLDNNVAYAGMEEESQSAISSIVSSLDPANFDYDDDAMEAFILEWIIAPIHANQDGVQEALNDMITLDENATSYQVYENLKAALLTAIASLSPTTQAAIIKAFGLDDDSGYEASINHTKEILQDKYDDMVSGLSLADLKIAGQLDIPEGTLLTWDELKQKIAEVKNTLGNDADSVKTYSVLTEKISAYNDVLSQTAEIVIDNTEVTQEYKDAILELGVSETELNTCFDENNKLVVKDAKALNQLVKSAKKNIAENIKLAKSQARLEYNSLVKQLNDTLNGVVKLDSATRDSVNTTLAQIDAVDKALYRYQLLEDTILGVNNAFKEFNDAKEIDELNTYGDSYVEMVQTIYDAYYKTGEVGSEAVESAVESLIDPTKLAGLEKGSEEYYKAVYDAFNKDIVPTLNLDEDSFSMDFASIKNFVSTGLGKIFTGESVKDFELIDGMSFEDAAKAMNKSETEMYAFFSALKQYTGVDYLAALDQSLEGRITNINSNIEELNRQKLTILEDGISDGEQEKLDEINASLYESQIKLRELGQEAHNTWKQYTDNEAVLDALNSVEDKTQYLTQSGAKKLGIEWDEVQGKTVQEAIDYLLAKQIELGEPTELTARLAIETIDSEIAELEEKIAEITADPTIVINPDQQIAEAKEKIQSLKNDKVELVTTFNIELSEEEKQNIKNELNSIEQITIHDKTFSVVANGAKEALKDLQNLKDFTLNNKSYTVTEYRQIKHHPTVLDPDGDGVIGVNGTAHVAGSAYSQGSWGTPKTETALVGELGPEIIVDPYSGRWHTVGDNGAEFTQVKRGSIIFNHKQTESLLKNGHVAGRGKAYASGTAHVGLFNPTSQKTEQSNKPGNDFSTTGDYLYNAANAISGAFKDAADSVEDFDETMDWIAIRMEEFEKRVGKLSAELENLTTYAEKNNKINEIIAENQKKYADSLAGAAYYENYAQKYLTGMNDELVAAAKNGAIAITEFTKEQDEATVKAIQNYRDSAQKAADLYQQAEEILTDIRDSVIQKIDNIQSYGDAKTSIEDAQTNKLQNAVDLIEESGYIASSAYYEAMMENSSKKKDYWMPLLADMQAEFDKAVQEGRIERGSIEWYEQLSKLYEIQSQIDEATIELEEFQNAINDIYWDNFDQLISRIGYLKDETQSLIDLMSHSDMVTTPETENGWSADDVQWTDEGLASLGLYAQQMEIAEYQSKQYAEAIDDLTKEYEAGHYSENEYLEKLNELKEGQYDSIEAYYEAQDAIKDLNAARIDAIKKGIEKEIDAYEDLIKKKKEALDADKDAYDFTKSTMEQQKSLAEIRRKLYALEGDNSASAVAQKKKLKAEEAEALAALDESYYDRSVENQQNALDKELESFQEQKDAEIKKWDEYLENIEQVVADSLNIVQANASEIGATLTDKANEYSLSVSDAVLSPWQDGALAVSDYQETFDTAMSSTMNQLDELKNKWQEVIDTMTEAGNASVDAINQENAKYAEATKTEPVKDVVPEPTQPQEDQYSTYTVKSGDTLSKIAQSQLGVSSKWRDIYDLNKDIISNPNLIYPGQKLKIPKYASGTLGVKKDQLAIIDELGDELIFHANNGKLSFLTKGSTVVPHDITENLMKLGALDPSDVLSRSTPQIGVHPEINNTEINIDNSIGELIHIDKCEQGTLPDVEKIVNNALEKHTQRLNQSLRKYVR